MDDGQYTIYKKLIILPVVYCLLLVAAPLSALAQSYQVDVLWQGTGYAPPFYKGRTLWANQTGLTVFAIPEIPGVDRSTLHYKWTRNGTVWPSSGTNVNSFFVAATILGNRHSLRIEILRPNGELLATKNFDMGPVGTSLLLYENNPRYGFLFNREVSGGYNMREQEVTFTAFPLFFTGKDKENENIAYSWRTNQGSAGANNSATYRIPDGASGSSQVTIKAEHRERLIQSERKTFEVTFGE